MVSNMKKYIHIMKKMLFLVPMAMMASCTIYHPQSVDIPLIDHQGEWRGDVAVGASSLVVIPDNVSLNATVTYGVTDWLAGQVHANYGVDNYYLQAAPGVYKAIGEKFVVEGYVGVGYGGVNHDESKNVTDTSTVYRVYDGHFVLPFVQLNFGWRRLGPVEIGFGVKAGGYLPDMEYHRLRATEPPTVKYEEIYTTPNFLLEPHVQLRIGGEHVNFTLRAGYSFLSDLDNGAERMTYDRFGLSMGLGFNF